jgi:hypothetical protein
MRQLESQKIKKALKVMGLRKNDFINYMKFASDVEELVVEYYEKDTSIKEDYYNLYGVFIDDEILKLKHELMNANNPRLVRDVQYYGKTIWDRIVDKAKYYVMDGKSPDGKYYSYKRPNGHIIARRAIP